MSSFWFFFIFFLGITKVLYRSIVKYPVSHKNILDSIDLITKNDTINCTYIWLIKNNLSVVSNGFTGPCAILGGGPEINYFTL